MQVMQDEVRKAQARGRKEQWLEDLVLLEILGKGGFGTVFRGLWRGTTAAVKVMYARQHERQAMKDALEMAVLTTLSHPHIVQMYSCLTNMVEDAGRSRPEVGLTWRLVSIAWQWSWTGWEMCVGKTSLSCYVVRWRITLSSASLGPCCDLLSGCVLDVPGWAPTYK